MLYKVLHLNDDLNTKITTNNNDNDIFEISKKEFYNKSLLEVAYIKNDYLFTETIDELEQCFNLTKNKVNGEKWIEDKENGISLTEYTVNNINYVILSGGFKKLS